MVSISMKWPVFRDTATDKELAIRYALANDNYYLYAVSDTTEYSCVLPRDAGENQLDFEDNYMDNATKLN